MVKNTEGLNVSVTDALLQEQWQVM